MIKKERFKIRDGVGLRAEIDWRHEHLLIFKEAIEHGVDVFFLCSFVTHEKKKINEITDLQEKIADGETMLLRIL